MIKFKVSAPGKIHLSGEHSVVYNKPALLAAVEKKVTAISALLKNDNIILYDKKNQKQKKLHYKEIENFTINYKKEDFWRVAKLAIGQTYKYFAKTPKYGFSLELDSELPAGCGMGSSAAISAAIVSTLFCLENEPWNTKKINKIVYETEKILHGNPSGADNTVITNGGALLFEKQESKNLIKKLDISKKLPNFILINTGKPAESTKEMVTKVAAAYKNQKQKYKKLFEETEEVTKNIINFFKNRSEKQSFTTFCNLITKNQRLLEAMGLVGQKAKHIITLIETYGGSAKISGAGGVKNGSGIIVAFSQNLRELENYLDQQNITCFRTSLSKQGITCEKI